LQVVPERINVTKYIANKSVFLDFYVAALYNLGFTAHT